MNRSLNVLATRACLAAAAVAFALAMNGCAQLEGDAGPTVVVPGPTIVATGSHLVTAGQTDRHLGHDQGTARTRATPSAAPIPPSPPSTARASSPASRRARPR
jgi:hypothetical protein